MSIRSAGIFRHPIRLLKGERLSGQRLVLSKAAEQQGVMVALYPTRDVAAALVQEGGEPVRQLHLTLAYLGRADELSELERLVPAVAGIAATTPSLQAEIAGIGKFTAGPEPVTYASVDAPALQDLRQRLCEMLVAAGFRPSSDHGFIPHITLAYADIDAEVPNLPLDFDEIALVIAGERQTFPLTGTDPKESQMAKGDFEAHWDEGRREVTVPLWKDDAKQIVYGVVMQPGVPDSQGDIVTAEEIEQAAHRYLAESRLQDVQHAEEPRDVVPVESFVAPCDLNYHGRPVHKGSWVMASHVVDPEIWQMVVKDELTGYSIGGTAERID